ncbi:helix-turn-helix domain-containing protein [Mucilaginibacter sp. L196]|uniref:helix-turn-helix domain-containing protein n=1 Tax=Mucilaginibacter sp. L196 TaxID=1641870 RepID=UPI00131B1D72|nr:helix-turn-helix transcriptional regulator [Mucilaginibacter sp. L196]
MQEILSKKNIGQRIKALRIENNYSQAYIANLLNISRSNYSQIELGNQFPTYEALSLIASYYSKTYDWLLHGPDFLAAKHPALKKQGFSKELPQASLTAPKRILTVNDSLNYVHRLHDVTYLNSLPIFDIPDSLIEGNCTCRGFTIDNSESLKHLYPGDILIGRQLTNFSEIGSSNDIYIVVTLTGVLFCRIDNIIVEKELLVCQNDESDKYFNPAVADIQEIWIAIGKYSAIIQPVINTLENMVLTIGESINLLEREVHKLNKKHRLKPL